ncbi:hypothetical protein BKA80DRAFT_38678 [Phyllosticta citrichinensis]
MPPALSEDEVSASETEIPYKEVDKKNKKNQPAKDEDEDDEDDDEDEDGQFAVEKVLSHMYDDANRKVLYEIMWAGFPKFEDRTWEPKENLMDGPLPIDHLQEYWDKECDGVEPKYIPKSKRKDADKGTKPRPGGKKRKLDQSAQSTPVAKETKGRRKSGRSQETEAPTPKEEAPLPSKEKESGALPPGSWENQIASIDTIVQEPHEKTGNMERYAYVSWTDGSKNRRTKHSMALLKQKCPQKLIEYFEQHLYWTEQPIHSSSD